MQPNYFSIGADRSVREVLVAVPLLGVAGLFAREGWCAASFLLVFELASVLRCAPTCGSLCHRNISHTASSFPAVTVICEGRVRW